MRRLLINCQTARGIKNILIKNELIDYIGAKKPEHDEVLNCSELLILPGMIDPHVHVRDMEQSKKETWKTASLAALAGGVTTIIDMPNTKPATTDLVGLQAKRKAAKKAKVNYKFHLGATENNLKELDQILKSDSSDIAGIKVFLAGSSSNEVVSDENKLKEIFKLAKKYDKVVLVHTEMQSCLDKWSQKISEKIIQNHDQIRNRECAIKGTTLILKLAEQIGNKLYICHVSTREEIELIRIAKKSSNNIFCEVTPHHLILDETILKQVGNFGKVNPPLRTKADNKALLEAIKTGTIDCLGTDHAPHTTDEKKQEYIKAPSGFPGLETAIPMTYFLVKENHISLKRYSELISGNAAKNFDVKNTGKLKVGYKADLMIIDQNAQELVKPDQFQTKAKYSPFDGRMVEMQIDRVFVNGKKYEFKAEKY